MKKVLILMIGLLSVPSLAMNPLSEDQTFEKRYVACPPNFQDGPQDMRMAIMYYKIDDEGFILSNTRVRVSGGFIFGHAKCSISEGVCRGDGGSVKGKGKIKVKDYSERVYLSLPIHGKSMGFSCNLKYSRASN